MNMGGPKGSTGPRKTVGQEKELRSPDIRDLIAPPSDEIVLKHQKIKKMSIINDIRGVVEKRREMKKLEGELGVSEEGEERKILSKEEKVVYWESIKEFGDEEDLSVGKHVEVCKFFMRSLRMREMFKVHYSKWIDEYKEDNSDFNRKTDIGDEDFKKFIEGRGVEYIREMSKLMVKSATTQFVEANLGEDIEDEEKQTKIDELNDDVNEFIVKNREALLSDDESVRVKLHTEFKDMIIGHGFEVDEDQIELYFEKIVKTVIFEQLAIGEYEKLSETMIAYDGEDMTDEEWDALMDEVLKKEYPELEEKIEEEEVKFVYSYGGGGNTTEVKSTGAFESLGSSSGVHFIPVGEGVYEVDSPEFKDKSQLPLIRMVDNKYFDIQMPYGDKGGNYSGEIVVNGSEVSKVKRCKFGDFQSVINRQLLDSRLNADIDVRQVTRSGERPNDIITDRNIGVIARDLFGFDLNQRPLTQPELNIFEGLMRILLKKPQNGDSLDKRVENLMNCLANKSNATTIRNILGYRSLDEKSNNVKRKGTNLVDMNMLVEMVKNKREGELKKIILE